MRSGTASFLIGAALVTLLALALVTVALGVLATLRAPYPDESPAAPPPPITRHGRWELRRLPDGSSEYAWIARQAGHFGPETRAPETAVPAARPRPGRHRKHQGIPG
ncbi:hypothetical protein OG689_18705 [Kitasatospora sp. NBC_00240]|uniref:hypothetical protein n=1 Tax=Kitasatospora sp. NBC_00240 TaxID=2903567 RepID=UPI00224F1957|nr:hypothetical protein [Kitasatospora sp. NBC_00240]MCX5211296.1 hypothetical protein [Kitasatospora sp. NBC_00240]